MNRKIIFLLLVLTSCIQDNDVYITTTVSRNEIVGNKEEIVSQTIKTLRAKDLLPIAVLTKVFNYNNDSRLKYLTGLTKKDGLQDYSLDSIYYDEKGNDTLKRSFTYVDKQRKATHVFRKRFREDKQVVYFMSEKPFGNKNYYKREIYYKYNADGQMLSETECECLGNARCDSISKKEYVYNQTKELDKKISYTWRAGGWKIIENNRN